MAASNWKILGIKPTTETRIIRSAYAARLKTIDVDADPAAFMALRDAYEWARDCARYSAYNDDDAEDSWTYEADAQHSEAHSEALSEAQSEVLSEPMQSDDDTLLPSPAFHYAIDLNIAPAGQNEALSQPDIDVPNPWAEQSGEAIYDQLLGIVYDDDKHGISLTLEEYTNAQTLTGRFLKWLDRTTIDQARDYEYSMANMMAYTIPRSDPMMETVPAYFGWEHTADQYDRPQEIGVVLERRDSNRAYEALINPAHRLHGAFAELTSPVETKRRGKKLRNQVRELLASARHNHPSLTSAFNDERVGEWQRTLKITDGPPASTNDNDSKGFNWIWIVFIILMTIGRLLAS